MPWLRESDNTHTEDTVLYGKTFSDIMLLLENDREFMYPEEKCGRNLSKEEKLILRRIRLREIARKEFTSAIQSAMDTLDEYTTEIIKATVPREKVIDGDVKTTQGWQDSGLCFDDYVKENDKVARDIIDYFANVLPPHKYDSVYLQAGEPVDNVREGERYRTFAYLCKDQTYGEIWQYRRHCLSGSLL